MRKLLPILLLLIFLLPALLPFFHRGFFVTDDGEWMVIRLSDFHRSLVDGQVPPRWAARLNHEYGYPVFNFLYPGMLYFGEIFHLFGFGFVDSVKALFVFTFIFSALFTFWWIKAVFKKEVEALVAALFFTYLPYHLFDVFRRGSLGEVTALVFVPLFFWAAKKNFLWLQGLTFGLMVLSHNIIALLFLPVFVFYIFLKKEEKKPAFIRLISPFFLGLLLSAFFWIPAIFELSLTQFNNVVISNPDDYFLTPQTIFLIGMVAVLIIFLLLPFVLKERKKIGLLFRSSRIPPEASVLADEANKKQSRGQIKPPAFVLGDALFFLVYLLAVFFSLPLSQFFWNFSFFKNLIQFPFRFLSLTLPAGAYLVASFLSRFEKQKKIIIGISLTAALLFFSRPYLTPREYINKEESFYTTNEGTTTVADEYMPIWVKIKPQNRPQNKVELVQGKGEIKNLSFNSKKTSFTFVGAERSIIQINTVYYPGWEAFLNNKRIDIDYQNEQGLIRLNLPKGENQLKLRFGETTLRLASDIISIVSLIIVVIMAVRLKI